METKENNNTASTHQEKARKLKKLRRWQIVVSLLGIVILIWGIIQVVCLFLNYKRTETSNDAQIEQYISPVNLRASGYIKKICFTEHQEVHKGDTLLILDDREYKIRVMEAEAALKDAQAGATVIGATLQTTQTTASVYDASCLLYTSDAADDWCHTTNHANYSLCLRRLHSRDRNPPYQAGERPPTIPESGEEKRCHPHSIGTDRNRICSYPQEVGSRETTTESCLVGCERSVTSP